MRIKFSSLSMAWNHPANASVCCWSLNQPSERMPFSPSCRQAHSANA